VRQRMLDWGWEDRRTSGLLLIIIVILALALLEVTKSIDLISDLTEIAVLIAAPLLGLGFGLMGSKTGHGKKEPDIRQVIPSSPSPPTPRKASSGHPKRTLRFVLETTSDWAEIGYVSGLSPLGELEKDPLIGRYDKIDTYPNYVHMNKHGSPNERAVVALKGEFEITPPGACELYIRKGDIGEVSLSVTDYDAKLELVSKQTLSRGLGVRDRLRINFDPLHP